MSTPWTGLDLQALVKEGTLEQAKIQLAQVLETLFMWQKGDIARGDVRRSVEMELTLVDPATGFVVNKAAEVADGDSIIQEFQPFQIEARTSHKDHWRSARAARHGIIEMYRRLIDRATAADVSVGSRAEARVWDARPEIEKPTSATHRAMVDGGMPSVYGYAWTCSMQSNISNALPLGDAYFAWRAMVEQFAHAVLALSANSADPRFRLASTRYFTGTTPWSFGVYDWPDYDAFLTTLVKQLRRGKIKGPHNLHPWVKVCVGVLEQRIADTQGDVRDTLCLHALMHAIAVWCYDRVIAGKEFVLTGQDDRQLSLAQSLETAACFGLSEEGRMHQVQHPTRDAFVSMQELFSWMHQEIGPVMVREGYGWEEHLLFGTIIPNADNGATRQTRYRSQKGDSALVEADIHRLKASVERVEGYLDRYDQISLDRLRDLRQAA